VFIAENHTHAGFDANNACKTAQKNGVTTLLLSMRQVGQTIWFPGAESLPTQSAQKPWPHGVRMRRPEAWRIGHSSRQMLHANLGSGPAKEGGSFLAFFAAQALWSCAMASNLSWRVCVSVCAGVHWTCMYWLPAPDDVALVGDVGLVRVPVVLRLVDVLELLLEQVDLVAGIYSAMLQG